MCRAVSGDQHEQPDAPARGDGAARVDDLRRARQRRRPARTGQQQQPAAQHDAAQPGRQAHADEAVAQPARPRHPAARLEQIAQAEELQQRQRRQHRQADHQHRDAEQPFQQRADADAPRTADEANAGRHHADAAASGSGGGSGGRGGGIGPATVRPRSTATASRMRPAAAAMRRPARRPGCWTCRDRGRAVSSRMGRPWQRIPAAIVRVSQAECDELKHAGGRSMVE